MRKNLLDGYSKIRDLCCYCLIKGKNIDFFLTLTLQKKVVSCVTSIKTDRNNSNNHKYRPRMWLQLKLGFNLVYNLVYTTCCGKNITLPVYLRNFSFLFFIWFLYTIADLSVSWKFTFAWTLLRTWAILRLLAWSLDWIKLSTVLLKLPWVTTLLEIVSLTTKFSVMKLPLTALLPMRHNRNNFDFIFSSLSNNTTGMESSIHCFCFNVILVFFF